MTAEKKGKPTRNKHMDKFIRHVAEQAAKATYNDKLIIPMKKPAAKKGKPDMNRAEVYCNIHRRWNCRWKCPIQPKRRAWRPSNEAVKIAHDTYHGTPTRFSEHTAIRRALTAAAKQDGVTR